MALIRLLTVMCSMLHLWNWLKLVSKGHWWGRHLLSLLIQHHGRTLPEGSVLNSSLTLAACREVSSSHYFGFCDLATTAIPFQVCPGSLCQKTTLSRHAPESSWHQVSKLCWSAYRCTRVRFEAKSDELESGAQEQEGLEHPFQQQLT